MPEAEYETRSDSVLAWKKAQKLGRFDPDAPSIEEQKVRAFDREIEKRGKSHCPLVIFDSMFVSRCHRFQGCARLCPMVKPKAIIQAMRGMFMLALANYGQLTPNDYTFTFVLKRTAACDGFCLFAHPTRGDEEDSSCLILQFVKKRGHFLTTTRKARKPWSNRHSTRSGMASLLFRANCIYGLAMPGQMADIRELLSSPSKVLDNALTGTVTF